jgi:polysaccharide export outer membrane protein
MGDAAVGSTIRIRNVQGVNLVQANQFPFRSRLSSILWTGVALALVVGGTRNVGAQVAPGAAPATGAPAAPTAIGQGAQTEGPRAVTETDRAREDANQHRSDVPAGSQDTRTEFQQMVEATTGRRLPIYGESMFRDVPSTFAPVNDVPVGPGYILGPGDEIHVQMSGQVNQQMRVTVDRSGSIAVPGIGSLHVAGMPYSELNQFLNEQLGKIYRNFTLNANLGALRTIQVFVVGQALRPGTYSISSLSTLTNAIFASGGPLPQGSLRDIQVRRGNETIDHFDLYDLLLNGDKSHDIPLMGGDVIFIPYVGPQVAVVGSVDNPAIFELKGKTTVADALKLAGGDTPVAAGATVRVERIFEHSQRSIQDISAGQKVTEVVQNGDIISVTSVIDRFKDAVTLRGNVANPGRYVWHPGMRISDLIPNKEALITRNYWRKRNLLGQLSQDYVPDLPDSAAHGEGALTTGSMGAQTTHGEGALELHSNSADRLAEPSNRGGATVDAGGSSVGAALTASNSPFGAKTDVVLSAPDIDWNYAVIERQSATDLTTSLIPFNLGDIVLRGDPRQNVELLPGDVVTIFSKSDIRVPGNQQTRYVRLEGEFIASGVYSVLPGETLRGLIRRVGGFTPDAYLYASEFTRESTRRVETQRLHEYADQLEAQISAVTSSNIARANTPSDQLAANASAADALSAVNRLRRVEPIGRIVLDLKPDSVGVDSLPDLALEDGDRFVVPRVPANVTVEGQVYNANAFVYSSGERMINYLERAGGPDREADKKRMFILRADGSVVSHQYAEVTRSPMYPGDTIVVPPVIDKRALLQRITSIASIVGNLGLGLAAIYLVSRD